MASDKKSGIESGFPFVIWHRLVPICLFAASLTAFSLTLTQRWTYDAVSYANQIHQFIESGKGGWLTHGHHLLFNPLGLLSWKILRLFGSSVNELGALQYMNAFLGALGLVLIYIIFLHGGLHLEKPDKPALAAPPYLALAATLALGCGYGYWDFSTDGRVYMPALLGFIATVGFALGMLDTPSFKQCIATGIATVLSIGLHQCHGLLIVASIGSMLLIPRDWRTRFIYALTYLAVYIFGTALLYVGIGVFVKGVRSYADLNYWMLAYAYDGRWWSFNIIANLYADIKALLHSFVSATPTQSEGGMSGIGKLFIKILCLGVSVASLFAAGHMIYAAWRAIKEKLSASDAKLYWGKFAVLLLVVLPYTAFFTIWVPGYFAYWMPIAFILTCYFTFIVASMRRNIQIALTALLFVFAFSAMATNLSATIVRRAHHQSSLTELSMTLKDLAVGNPIIIMTGFGELAAGETYIPYFSQIERIYSLNIVFKRTGGDIGKGVDNIRSAIADQLSKGGQVIVLSEFWDAGAWRDIVKRYKDISPAVADEITAGYTRESIGRSGKYEIFRLVPQPVTPSQQPGD